MTPSGPAAPAQKVVLASASPRRRALLGAMHVDFAFRSADLDESALPGEDPQAYVARLAAAKALAVADALGDPEVLVIGADTAIDLDGLVLGKPVDDAHAETMLRLLSGRSHRVLTAVAVRRRGATQVGVEQATVTFHALSDETIEEYVRSGEPADAAGAYAIQGRGAALVAHVEGHRSTVIGLPVGLLVRLGRVVGVDLAPSR